MGFNSGFKGLNWKENIARKRKQMDLKTKRDQPVDRE